MKLLERILPRHFAVPIFAAMAKRPGKLGQSAKRSLRRATVEFSLKEFVRRCAALTYKDICMDCGAHVGTVTERLAATGAAVHSYEPDPATFSALHARVGHLPNVTLYQSAIGVDAGAVYLKRHISEPTPFQDASSATSVYFKDPMRFSGDEIEVPQRAFQDELARLGARVALVKMDIEGSEFEILRDVFQSPETQSFDALFVETHERFEPARMPMIARLRQKSLRLKRPFISLDWP